MNETNSTIATPGTDPEPTVEQGPPWLVELFVEPPGWMAPLLIGAIVAVALVLVFALAKLREDLDDEELRELGLECAQVLLIVGCMGGATKLLVEFGGFAYWIDVFGGATLGFACSQAILRGVPRVIDVEGLEMATGSKD